MSGKSPWSVKGISPEDREAAKVAARKAGMPIGAWLSEQIRMASAEKPAEPEEHAAPEASSQDHSSQDHSGGHAGHHPERERRRGGHVDPRFAFGRGQWSVAEEAVDAGVVADSSAGYPWQFRVVPGSTQQAPAHPPPANTAYTPPPPAPPASVPVPAPAAHQPPVIADAVPRQDVEALERRIEAIEGDIRDLGDRISAAEDRMLARFEPLLGKIEDLNGEVEHLKSRPATELPEDELSFSTAPIERAVMRLSERLGRIERVVLPGQRGGQRGFFSRLFRRG